MAASLPVTVPAAPMTAVPAIARRPLARWLAVARRAVRERSMGRRSCGAVRIGRGGPLARVGVRAMGLFRPPLPVAGRPAMAVAMIVSQG